MRIRDTWMGCGTPACNGGVQGLGSVSPVMSGKYMGAIGKVVSMGGLGTTHLAPVKQASSQLAQMGIYAPPSVRATVGLGSTRDKAMCQASFGAGQAATGVASGMHTQSGGGDAGWSAALGISSALMTVGGAFCNLIDTGSPAAGFDPTTGSNMLMPAPAPAPAQPDWMLIGGAAVAALVVGALIFGK